MVYYIQYCYFSGLCSSLNSKMKTRRFGSCVFSCVQVSSPATHHGGAWGERMYSSYSFTISALYGGEWSASRPGRAFTPGERTPDTHCTGDWVGPRAGLDTEARGKILCLRRDRTPIARSSSP
jgi:hypothetical protein